MSKKHYAMIAERLRCAHLLAEHREPIAHLARSMADDFAAENTRFDRARFLTACGVTA